MSDIEWWNSTKKTNMFMKGWHNSVTLKLCCVAKVNKYFNVFICGKLLFNFFVPSWTVLFTWFTVLNRTWHAACDYAHDKDKFIFWNCRVINSMLIIAVIKINFIFYLNTFCLTFFIDLASPIDDFNVNKSTIFFTQVTHCYNFD